MSRAARLCICAVVACCAIAAAPAVWARGYDLPDADIELVVESDGSLRVTELITFAFDGEFSGAYRDIPSRFGERVPLDSVRVSEQGRAYAPGGTTTLGEPGPPGTFAVGEHEGGVRIVWRYRANDEVRTFTVSYRMLDLVRVHDDVADLNMRVWGDQWPSTLGRLRARVVLPAQSGPDERLRVWGHPAAVRGVTALDSGTGTATLDAVRVPAGQWVEMRVLFPTQMLSATAGAVRVPGRALDTIVADQQAAAAEADAAEARQRWLTSNAWWLVIVGILGVGGPGVVLLVWIYRRHGTDRLSGPPVDYVREPPSQDSPALVGALMREGREVGPEEFLATFFELLRRGYFTATHEHTDRRTWMGLRNETISDLRVRRSELPADDLDVWDDHVYRTVTWILPAEGRLLSEFSQAFQERARDFYNRFKDFRAAVAGEVGRRGYIEHSGRSVALAGAGGFVALAILGLLAVWFGGPGATIAGAGMIVVGISNTVVLGIGAAVAPTALTRRSKQGAELCAAWAGLRRYLDDFSAMRDAPPVSLALWERLLVYGIVLGVADRVLQAAQIVAPVELQERSSLYWIDTSGPGGGLTSSSLSSLTSGIGRAVSAGTPSSSSGGGGGFSSGGGRGGGGGGGGAW